MDGIYGPFFLVCTHCSNLGSLWISDTKSLYIIKCDSVVTFVYTFLTLIKSVIEFKRMKLETWDLQHSLWFLKLFPMNIRQLKKSYRKALQSLVYYCSCIYDAHCIEVNLKCWLDSIGCIIWKNKASNLQLSPLSLFFDAASNKPKTT